MTQAFTWRAYRDTSDLVMMRSFLSAAYQSSEHGLADGMWHPGDMTWAVFLNSLVGPIDRGDLWFDAGGRLAAIVWRYKGGAEMTIRPDLRRPDTIDGLLSLVIARLDALRLESGATTPLTIGAVEGVDDIGACLRAFGFVADNHDPMTIFRKNFADSPVRDVPLAPGFTIRAIAGPVDYADRVAIHREVWEPSKVTVAGFERLQTMPGYDPALDIVAVAPDGRFAAYCILWHDPVTRTCELEPVGAREEFRGRGLTKAVLAEALRRGQARGAVTAWVYTDESRTAAQALYRSVGFAPVARYIAYVRN